MDARSGVPERSLFTDFGHKANVNVSAPPYDHSEGDSPALDDGEIDALVAFLGTLTDEVVPK